MISESNWISELVPTTRSLASAESPAEVFKLLVAAGRGLAPRAAVFLVRHGEVQGWNATGYPLEVCRRLREYRANLEEGWLGRFAAGPEGVLGFRPSAGSDPDFGQPVSAEALAAAIRVKGKPIALVLAERRPHEEPWSPEGLQLLITVAELRLELNLALRKAAAQTQATDPREVESEARADRRGASAVPTIVHPGSAPTPHILAQPATGVAPLAERVPEVLSPALEAARRYARLVATDIRLYNEDAVALGRRNRDLADRLGEQLGRGRETFLKRHAALGAQGLDLLRDAYVQVLAGDDRDLIPSNLFG